MHTDRTAVDHNAAAFVASVDDHNPPGGIADVGTPGVWPLARRVAAKLRPHSAPGHVHPYAVEVQGLNARVTRCKCGTGPVGVCPRHYPAAYALDAARHRADTPAVAS